MLVWFYKRLSYIYIETNTVYVIMLFVTVELQFISRIKWILMVAKMLLNHQYTEK